MFLMFLIINVLIFVDAVVNERKNNFYEFTFLLFKNCSTIWITFKVNIEVFLKKKKVIKLVDSGKDTFSVRDLSTIWHRVKLTVRVRQRWGGGSKFVLSEASSSSSSSLECLPEPLDKNDIYIHLSKRQK